MLQFVQTILVKDSGKIHRVDLRQQRKSNRYPYQTGVKIETGDEQNQKKRQKTYQHDENGKDPVFHGKHKGMFDGGSDILVKVSERREQETSHSRRKKSNTQQNYLNDQTHAVCTEKRAPKIKCQKDGDSGCNQKKDGGFFEVKDKFFEKRMHHRDILTKAKP